MQRWDYYIDNKHIVIYTFVHGDTFIISGNRNQLLTIIKLKPDSDNLLYQPAWVFQLSLINQVECIQASYLLLSTQAAASSYVL